MMNGLGFGLGHGVFGGLGMILVWLLPLLLLAWAIKRFTERDDTRTQTTRALLQQSYARCAHRREEHQRNLAEIRKS
ncbi:hypothetical protein [Magnetofaba australis]|uniref:Putative membrane protein n=1 Tax=Magnetofaba australis IT-1 TaxID=1434232 RepID=A0A1Y2K6S7_9PROT|nr:hypothetical protein [Magnetofaba australis]OSM04131.1 putative membrane protein [Magnetofaba australis IT-1]